MKKLQAIIISFVVLMLFGVIASFIYNRFPTTLVLFLLLVMMFFVVLALYGYWKKVMKGEHSYSKYSKVNDTIFPELEEDLLSVLPLDFIAKFEKQKGELVFFGDDNSFQEEALKVDYNKLTDEFVMKFRGFTVLFKDLATVEVGDEQINIFSAKQMRVKRGKQDYLVVDKNGNRKEVNREGVTRKYKSDLPFLVFSRG